MIRIQSGEPPDSVATVVLARDPPPPAADEEDEDEEEEEDSDGRGEGEGSGTGEGEVGGSSPSIPISAAAMGDKALE